LIVDRPITRTAGALFALHAMLPLPSFQPSARIRVAADGNGGDSM
jgi:hypothetical protein